MAETLQEVKDILATSIAIGLDIPAIPGMTAWQVTILDAEVLDPTEARDITLGFYPTQKAAVRGLAQWVVRDLLSLAEVGLEAPWEEKGETADEWLSHLTAADIVNAYFIGNPSDFYEIKEIKIRRDGNLEGALTAAECSTALE